MVCVCVCIVCIYINILYTHTIDSASQKNAAQRMPKTITKSKFTAFILTLCKFYNLRKTLAIIKYTRFSNNLS